MNDQANTEQTTSACAASRAESANSTGGLGMDMDRCGLEILERVRDQLAATGRADIADKINQAITLIDGGLHRIVTMHKSAQMAVSAECDFERGTWTFDIAEGVRVAAGRYALIPLPNKDLAPPACGDQQGSRDRTPD